MSKADNKRQQIWTYLRDHPGTSSVDVAGALGLDEAPTRTHMWNMYNRGMLSRQSDQKPEPNTMGGAIKFYRYFAVGTTYEFKRKPTGRPLKKKEAKPQAKRGPYKKRMELVREGISAAAQPAPTPAVVGSWLDDDTKVAQFLLDLNVRQLLRMRRVLTGMMDGAARKEAA